MADDKKILKTENTTSKNFSYKLGAVALSFSLRTDIKQELKDFKELLVRALEDVTEELKSYE